MLLYTKVWVFEYSVGIAHDNITENACASHLVLNHCTKSMKLLCCYADLSPTWLTDLITRMTYPVFFLFYHLSELTSITSLPTYLPPSSRSHLSGQRHISDYTGTLNVIGHYWWTFDARNILLGCITPLTSYMGLSLHTLTQSSSCTRTVYSVIIPC